MADDQWNLKESTGAAATEKVINEQGEETVKTNTMIFSLKDQPGGLARALKVFQVGPSSLSSQVKSLIFDSWLMNWN